MSRHEIDAEVRTIAGWQDAGEAIVNEAKMLDADLVVMGGYGHSRLREWVLGGNLNRSVRPLSQSGYRIVSMSGANPRRWS